MPRGRYNYYSQTDFRGGICCEQTEAQANQVADACNVWCPNGVLESRPGFRGLVNVTGPLLDGTASTLSAFAYVATGATWRSPVAGTLSLAGLTAGDSIYIGHNNAPDVGSLWGYSGTGNTAALQIVASYWNGSEWARLTVVQHGADTGGLGPYWFSVTSGRTSFLYVAPADWATTAVNGTTTYWLRFDIKSGTITAGTDFSVGTPSGGYTAATPNVGLHVAQFSSCKRYIGQIIEAGQQRLYTYNLTTPLGNCTWYYTSSTETYAVAAQEPGSCIVIPQFDEAYSAYNHIVMRHVPQPVGSYGGAVDRAKVETLPEYVGTVLGVKSPYHPDYVGQLGVWPAAKFLEFFHGQIWAANLLDEPFTIRWSAPQPYHKVWPSESYELLMEDDNSPITGIRAFGEHLVVAKQDSLWLMVHNGTSEEGNNTYTPTKIMAGSGVGCAAGATMVPVNGRLFFLAEDGVYSFDGSNIEKLSDAIQPIIDRIEPSSRYRACAAHWRTEGVYLLAVPLDGSDVNNAVLVYDYMNRAWWYWDGFNVQHWLIDEGYHDEETVIFGDQYGDLYLLGASTSDNGAATDSWVTLHRWGAPGINVKTLRELRVVAENVGLDDLDVTVTRNDDPDTAATASLDFTDTLEAKVGTAVLDTAKTTSEKRRLRKIALRNCGRTLQLKLGDAVKGIAMKLVEVWGGAKPQGVR